MNTTKTIDERLASATVDLLDLEKCPKAVLLFSIYDTKAKEYGVPSTASSASILVASIMGLIKDQPSSPFAIRPADFTLHCVGSWSPTYGLVYTERGNTYVGHLHELIEHLTPDDLAAMLASIDRMYNNIMNSKTENASQ